ncbi:MAG: hypothetical protein KKD94_02450, partial [Nanoarchaeota archaeon]|nr:hypothetical protein [Nanoarchaeota archaeon]
TKAKPKKRKKRYKYEDTVALVQSFTAKELKLPPLKIPRSKLPKAIPMFQTIGIRRLPKIVA